MNKKITILEGQTGSLKITPTFEGKPILNKIEVDWDNTDMGDMVVLGRAMTAVDRKSMTMPVTALSTSKGTGRLVFRYKESKSHDENVGTSTKNLDITVSPALLTVETFTPSMLKWIPGQESDIALTWKNGTQSIYADDPLLELVVLGESIEIVSRSKSGIRVRVRDSVNPALLPNKEQMVIAYFYSGLAKSTFTFRVKPNLVITSTGLIHLKAKGSTAPFPFKVMDGNKDVTKELKNIRVTDASLKVNEDGSVVALKIDLLNIIRTVTYIFDYEVDGLVWTYSTKTTITIGSVLAL